MIVQVAHQLIFPIESFVEVEGQQKALAFPSITIEDGRRVSFKSSSSIDDVDRLLGSVGSVDLTHGGDWGDIDGDAVAGFCCFDNLWEIGVTGESGWLPWRVTM